MGHKAGVHAGRVHSSTWTFTSCVVHLITAVLTVNGSASSSCHGRLVFGERSSALVAFHLSRYRNLDQFPNSFRLGRHRVFLSRGLRDSCTLCRWNCVWFDGLELDRYRVVFEVNRGDGEKFSFFSHVTNFWMVTAAFCHEIPRIRII